MRLYEEGYKLKDNELLLKIEKKQSVYQNGTYVKCDVGFLTKLTKVGRLPSAFASWGNPYSCNTKNPVKPLPIYVVEETHKKGWKLLGWRFGQSQNWATLLHPDGYTVEIYLQQFLEIIKHKTLVNGEIMGEFLWDDHRLLAKDKPK